MAKKSTRLEALCEIFHENGITSDRLEGNGVLIEKIKEQADAVPDYRHPSYTRHLLGDIIMIVFFAVLGNANEWAEIESFARALSLWMQKKAAVPGGKQGDYVLALKGNQPLFYQEVKDFFDEEEQEKIRRNGKNWKKTVEKEHGGHCDKGVFYNR